MSRATVCILNKKCQSLISISPFSFQYPSHCTWISADDKENKRISMLRAHRDRRHTFCAFVKPGGRSKQRSWFFSPEISFCWWCQVTRAQSAGRMHDTMECESATEASSSLNALYIWQMQTHSDPPLINTCLVIFLWAWAFSITVTLRVSSQQKLLTVQPVPCYLDLQPDN